MPVDCGFPFMFGIYGTRPTRESVALLKSTGACGVLLLGRNIETAEQTRALTEELTQRAGRPLLFSIDHEGGWVLRFKSGVTAFPGNAALGKTRDPKLAYAVGAAMGRELSGLGIQINLAPVLDVVEDYNPGIGIRSFGDDPALVGALGRAMIRGLQDNGVSACAKHFPGKGAARVDAHIELPRIVLSKARFERVHLAPFSRAIAAGVDCVMTSHVRFPALDSAPATFSRTITEDILRGRLGFKGAIISDDLCMGAVARERPIQSAAVQALEAGHDILLIAHDLQTQREAAELLSGQVQDDPAAARRVAEACARIRRLYDRSSRTPPPPDPARAEALSRRIAAAAIEIIQRGAVPLPLTPDGSPPLVLFPDFSEVKDKFTFEGGIAAPQGEVKDILAEWGAAKVRKTPIESSDLAGLKAAVEKAKRILFFCFEARRFPGQKAVLRLLKDKAPERSVVVVIRGTWDRALLSPAMTAVDSRGYRNTSLRAALKLVLGLSAAALCLLRPGSEARAESAVELRQAFIAETDDSRRMELLKALSESVPASPADVRALFDLFSRLPVPEVRAAVISSLRRAKPGGADLEHAFIPYFDQSDPEPIFFAITGVLAVRDEKALPYLRKLSKQKFAARSPDELSLSSEKNSWWAHYEALSALAQWEGPKALPLLRKAARQAPAAARILASFLWKEALPEIVSWSSSSSGDDRERAKEALAVPVDAARLRETRGEMLKLLRDPGADKELRHQLAIKVGLCSSAEEVEELLKEIDAPGEAHLKLLLTTAVFASRSPRAVPLLKSYVRDNPDPRARAGALAELKELSSSQDYVLLLEWTAKNDPDAGNKEEARRQLRELKKP